MTLRSGDSEPSAHPRNRGVPCKGRTVIRHSREHADPALRGQPILDDDNARQYRACEAYAANGTEYCVSHGGNAPQAINAAKRGIALATPNAFEVLRRIAEDETVAAETRIKAAAQLLDRGGVRPGLDISLETPAWQRMLQEEFGDESSEDEAVPPTPSAKPVEAIAKPVKAARPAKKAAPAPKPKPEETKPAPRKARPTSTTPKFEGW